MLPVALRLPDEEERDECCKFELEEEEEYTSTDADRMDLAENGRDDSC